MVKNLNDFLKLLEEDSNPTNRGFESKLLVLAEEIKGNEEETKKVENILIRLSEKVNSFSTEEFQVITLFINASAFNNNQKIFEAFHEKLIVVKKGNNKRRESLLLNLLTTLAPNFVLS